MIKLLAETKGSFQLHDLAHRGQLIRSHRPCVVENSHFIQDRIGRDQIRVLGELKAEATDADFASYFKEAEGDVALAIDSFLAEFGKEAPEKAEKPKRGRKPKAPEGEQGDDD